MRVEMGGFIEVPLTVAEQYVLIIARLRWQAPATIFCIQRG